MSDHTMKYRRITVPMGFKENVQGGIRHSKYISGTIFDGMGTVICKF